MLVESFGPQAMHFLPGNIFMTVVHLGSSVACLMLASSQRLPMEAHVAWQLLLLGPLIQASPAVSVSVSVSVRESESVIASVSVCECECACECWWECEGEGE